MKKLTLISLLAIVSCSVENNDYECPTREITLNTRVVLSSETAPMFGSKSTASCEFPDPYEHPIPSEFNVYFVSDTETYEFTGVKEGNNTFELPAVEYRIVVTNSDKKYRGDLPIYSEALYLFGENVIDFSTTDEGSVIVTNDYASVMVVNNAAIKSVPKLDGQNMMLAGEYYNLYTRKDGVSYLTIGDGINRNFSANEVYRFMICPTGRFNIIIDTNVLTTVTDEIL